MNDKSLTSSKQAINQFLQQAKQTPVLATTGGRLIFALDATASREPTWDLACDLQSEMFSATQALGGLEVQLVHYKGYRDIRVSPWQKQSSQLLREMQGVHCLGGRTQLEAVLLHAATESRQKKVQAVVFVGDAMEEDIDAVCHAAGILGALNVPVFMFLEGDDPVAYRTFEQVARLTRGALLPFDAHSADGLRDLLGAVAVYAAGGRKALDHWSRRRGGQVEHLRQQLLQKL